jgi:hypothetical protein
VTTPVIWAADVRPTALALVGLKKETTVGWLEAIGMPVSPVIPFKVSWIRLEDGGSITTPYDPAGDEVVIKVPEPNVREFICTEVNVEEMVRGPTIYDPP